MNSTLKKVGNSKYTMANGSITDSGVHSLKLNWLGQEKMVFVIASESNFSLVGMELLFNTKLAMKPSEGILVLER